MSIRDLREKFFAAHVCGCCNAPWSLLSSIIEHIGRLETNTVDSVTVADTKTIAPGQPAYVVNQGTPKNVKLEFGIPEGIPGVNSVEVGETLTLEPGSDAYVRNVGDYDHLNLEFGIPQGIQGETGPQGIQGDAAPAELVVPAVNAWLTAHPEATTTVQDGSITDAKLVQTGGVLEEVHDIRKGANGVTYASAGAAVRDQIGQIIDFDSLLSASGTQDSYVSAAASEVTGTAQNIAECTVGETLTIYATVTATVHPEAYTSVGIRINEYSSSDAVLRRTNYEDISSPIEYTVVNSDCAYIIVFTRITKTAGEGGGYHELLNYEFNVLGDKKSIQEDVIIPSVSAIESDVKILQDTDEGLTTGYHRITAEIEHGSISSSTGQNTANNLYIRPTGYIPTDNVYKVHWHGSSDVRIYVYYYNYANDTYTFETMAGNQADINLPIFINKNYTHFRFVAYYTTAPYGIGLDNFWNVFSIYSPFTTIPNYWLDYMVDKVQTITEKDMLIGENGTSFVFITDIHTQYNSMVSPKLIKYIADNTAVDRVVNGGDLLTIYASKKQAVEELRLWRDSMNGLEEIRLRGNHDLNNYNNTNAANALTVGEWYGLMVRPTERFINTGAKTYYTVDNDSQKFRLIVLDSELTGDAWTTEITWLQSALTEKGSDWTILVMQHTLFNTTNTNLSAIGQRVVDAINAVYSNISATFIGIWAGHSHKDYNTTESVNGYALILTNCDTRDGGYSGLTRNYGTTNEQSFDVAHIDFNNRVIYTTRIGAGSDRQIAY